TCSGCGPDLRPRSCARGAGSGRPSSWSLAGLHLLLPGHRALRTAPAAGVGTGALAAHGQAAAVTLAAVGADFGEALDVGRHLAAEIAFDDDLLACRKAVDDLAKPPDLLLGEVLGPFVRVDVGHLQDLLGGGVADPVDVRQGDCHALLRGYVDAGDSRHLVS